MNGSGSRIPKSEASAGRPPRAPGKRSGNATRPLAFLGNTREGMVCEVCRLLLQLGHRAVRLPCGQGSHVPLARYVFETLARSAAPAPWSTSPPVNCGTQHPRRDALESAVEADPGLRNRVRRDHRRRGSTQPGVLVRMGPEQPGCRAATRCCFVGGPGATFRNREKSTAAVGRRTYAPERFTLRFT